MVILVAEVAKREKSVDSDPSESGSTPENVAAPSVLRNQPESVIDRVPLLRVKWLAAIGALLGGLVALGLDEATAELIPPETVHQTIMGQKSTVISRSTPRVIKQSEALASGLLGACLCGFLGLAGGLARRSVSAAALWEGSGVVLGLVLGAGLSFALFPVFFWARDHYLEQEMISSLVLHGLIWAPSEPRPA